MSKLRREPYTELGALRGKCFRCKGKRGKCIYQWKTCARPGYVLLCQKCDYELNEAALQYLKVPAKEIKALMKAYLVKQQKQVAHLESAYGVKINV